MAYKSIMLTALMSCL